MNDQPDPNPSQGIPKRWTARQKAAVIRAIRRKAITVWDACERYDLSAAELIEWECNLDRFGVPGLKVKWTNRKMSASK
jgi:hypothetical protein